MTKKVKIRNQNNVRAFASLRNGPLLVPSVPNHRRYNSTSTIAASIYSVVDDIVSSWASLRLVAIRRNYC